MSESLSLSPRSEIFERGVASDMRMGEINVGKNAASEKKTFQERQETADIPLVLHPLWRLGLPHCYFF